MYFTIIIGDKNFYCTLLYWWTCIICSGKALVSLLKSFWDELEEIVTDMNGNRIFINKNIKSGLKGTKY